MAREDIQGELRCGDLVIAVSAWIDDDPSTAPSYARGGVNYGEAWIAEGDLMGQLPADAKCVLGSDSGELRIRVHSYDQGGKRAQFVAEP